MVTIPFVLVGGLLRAIGSACAWVAGAVDSTFRVAATIQALLLPVWALLAGRYIGRDDVKDGSVLWSAAAGLYALCAVLLGYPTLAVVAVVGSTAAYAATAALKLSLRGWAGWLAAALVAGLMAWGMERYGTSLQLPCWPLVPLSWCCLTLGAAYGVRREAGGRLRNGGAARLLLLATAMAAAAAGPSAVRAARVAGFPPGTPPVPVVPAPPPPVSMDGLPGREAAGSAAQARQPARATAPHRGGQDTKPAVALHSKRPRT